MRPSGYWFAAACFVLAACDAGTVTAQQRRQYTPQRPTISPYFGFFQYNTTPLPNYQAFVQPRQELDTSLRSESNRIGTIERQLRLRNANAAGGLLRESESDVGAASRAADFLNLQPYYPLQQSIRTRR